MLPARDEHRAHEIDADGIRRRRADAPAGATGCIQQMSAGERRRQHLGGTFIERAYGGLGIVPLGP